MMKRISIISILIFTLFLSFNISADEYIPWQQDDYAIYNADKFDITKKATVDLHIGNWRHFTEFAGLGQFWVYAALSSQRVYLYSPDDYSLHYFVDFDSQVGTRTHIDVSPCNNGAVTLGAKNQELILPAGYFSDIIRLDLEPSCADAGVTNMWFAKGVGPIQWAESNITGRVLYQMVRADINGETYPIKSSIILKGHFPDPTLWINRMPPIPEPPPIKKARVAMTIENHSQETLFYNFSTSQQFDIYITDEKGQVVSKWSRDQEFLQVATHIEIRPGKDFTFGGNVDLAYDDGQSLRPGNYKLRIFLTNYDPLDSITNVFNVSSPASEMPVRIRWAH